jgi:hypothetical protein
MENNSDEEKYTDFKLVTSFSGVELKDSPIGDSLRGSMVDGSVFCLNPKSALLSSRNTLSCWYCNMGISE